MAPKIVALRSPSLLVHGLAWWPFLGALVYFSIGSAIWRVIHFMIGAFVQSFFEYVVHAWIFHGPLWFMHKGHHLKPGDRSRLLVPLVFSFPMGMLEWCAFSCFIDPRVVTTMAVGAAFWHILFEYVHYAEHQPHQLLWLQRTAWFKRLQFYHKIHHYEDGQRYRYYGFTTIFWDWVFGTDKVEEPQVQPQESESAPRSAPIEWWGWVPRIPFL